nr:reverse transcriptase domain-containing protein [Tanacetum cinerariifolium]
MIGSLMYLKTSRTYIMFAVCAYSRFQVTPKLSHLHDVKQIFRKSTTGGCQFLGRRLISWQCKKHTIVATSTTEAEYVVAANCPLMHKRFQMSSIRELTFFLGLQVKQSKEGIFISQDKYVAEILKKFDFSSIKTTSTPIETQKPLVKDEEAADSLGVPVYVVPKKEGMTVRCMTAIFHELVEDSMEVFMDDFSIFGSSVDHYLKNLEKMLKRCEETNLVLNWEKCHFMVKEGIVLGHKASGLRIEILPKRYVDGLKKRYLFDFEGIEKYEVKIQFIEVAPCGFFRRGFRFNVTIFEFNGVATKTLFLVLVDDVEWF